jgi:CBS domain-containing protein
MEIRDLLGHKGTDIFSISPDDSIGAAVKEMNEKHIGALVVMDSANDIAGILSERDILKRMEDCGIDKKVSEVMTPKEKLIIGHETDSIEYAMSIFTNHKIRHLPIIDENTKLVGLVSIGDVVKASLDNAEFEKKNLMNYITGSYNA